MKVYKNWYDNPLCKSIQEKKYRLKNETSCLDMIKRVTSCIKDKKVAENISNLMKNGDFMFGGRILYGAGNDKNITISNCYILPSPEDSMNSIMDTAKNMATVFKAGGGVGVDISKLRPNGAQTNNGARTSTGSVSFMNIFNAVGACVGFHGRRGATLIGLDINHPDIKDFIEIRKDNDLSAMNISIKCTHDFIQAVKDKANYKLQFHVDATGEDIEKIVSAESLFNDICEMAWNYGDPGILYMDNMREHNYQSNNKDFHIDICNPCVTGSTFILTKRGYKRIDSLVDKEVEIWNGFEWSKVVPKVTGHNQKMLRVIASNGISIDCTRYHKFILKDGTRVKAEELSAGDKLAKWKYPIIETTANIEQDFDAYTAGFYAGDSTKNKKEVALYGNKKSLLRYLDYCHYKNQKNRILAFLNKVPDDKFFVPSIKDSIKFRLNWLAGIIDSDGSKNDKTGSVNISSINYSFLQKIQLMLNTLGCCSYVNVLTNSQKAYRLTISAYEVEQLLSLGLILYRVDVAPKTNRNVSRFIYIKQIEEIPNEETVYCFNEPKNHSGVFNGIMTAQCSEYNGPEGNSCLLGSLNLYNFVEDKFTNKAYFNSQRFIKAVENAVVALDEFLDYGYSKQPLQIFKDNIDKWRSIGLGFFGLADVFIALGVKYGSDESCAITTKILRVMQISAVKTSIRLAKEKGCFKLCNKKALSENHMIAELDKYYGKGLKEFILKYGMRNAQLLSIAPSGSISLLCNEASGGIEPIFKVFMKRTSHGLEKEGKTFNVLAHSVAELVKYHNEHNDDKISEDFSDDKKLPVILAKIKKIYPSVIEAEEVNSLDKLNLQHVIQEHVDNAISSTINLKQSATIKDVKDIYLKADEYGLKGITVFREGCKRASILNVDTNKNSKLDSILPIPAAQAHLKKNGLVGKTYLVHSACVNRMYVTVNTLNGKLFEVFQNSAKKGCTSNIATITSLVSLSLRSGIKVPKIIEKLREHTCQACVFHRSKDHDSTCANSCGDAIASCLEQSYKHLGQIHDDTDLEEAIKESVDEGGEECPNCHNFTLQPDGRCRTCTACGWSKCE